MTVEQVMHDLHNQSHLLLLELVSMCKLRKEKAIKPKCATSSQDWREFCISQLSKNVGARVLHRYTNRNNAAPGVPLYKPLGLNVGPKCPNDAVELEASNWKKYWQKPHSQREAQSVLQRMRNECMGLLSMELRPSPFYV